MTVIEVKDSIRKFLKKTNKSLDSILQNLIGETLFIALLLDGSSF